MSRAPMNPRDRRAVTLGLAVLVPALLWVYGLQPARTALADTQDRLAMERDALARERGAIAEAARSPDRKRVADSALAAVQGRVFAGPNDVAAGASLVSYLGDVARRSNVWLASAATRSSTAMASAAGAATSTSAAGSTGSTNGGRAAAASARSASAIAAAAASAAGLRPLRVELRAESDFQGLLGFLDALERGQKVITVERVDVARTFRAGEEDREILTITATVVGYALPIAPAVAGATLPPTRSPAGPGVTP